jgi:hypothetical protein
MNWRAVLAVLALVLFAVAFGFLTTRYGDQEDAVLCAGLYAHARTAADTAAIDANLSPKERGRQYRNNVRTCGELRRVGVGPLRP